jgi:hypothetical protein
MSTIQRRPLPPPMTVPDVNRALINDAGFRRTVEDKAKEIAGQGSIGYIRDVRQTGDTFEVEVTVQSLAAGQVTRTRTVNVPVTPADVVDAFVGFPAPPRELNEE